jgi:hypothetical protein
MRASTRARFAFVFAAPCLALGCMQQPQEGLDDQDPHSPGELIGFFSVTGKLSDDSCGADNLGVPATWDFDLKLSREGTTLYWLNGREAITGDIDRKGAFSFQTHIDVRLSEQKGAVKGCTVVRSDVASGSLKNDDELSGTLSYAYSAGSGSDCATLPLGAEGYPLTLPCGFSYRLSGSRTE